VLAVFCCFLQVFAVFCRFLLIFDDFRNLEDDCFEAGRACPCNSHMALTLAPDREYTTQQPSLQHDFRRNTLAQASATLQSFPTE